MARLILAIVAFLLVMVVIKMIIIAIVIAGLIFRTRETIGLLAIGGIISFIAAFPVIGISLAVLIGAVALYRACSKDGQAKLAMDDPDQE